MKQLIFLLAFIQLGLIPQLGMAQVDPSKEYKADFLVSLFGKKRNAPEVVKMMEFYQMEAGGYGGPLETGWYSETYPLSIGFQHTDHDFDYQVDSLLFNEITFANTLEHIEGDRYRVEGHNLPFDIPLNVQMSDAEKFGARNTSTHVGQSFTFEKDHITVVVFFDEAEGFLYCSQVSVSNYAVTPSGE